MLSAITNDKRGFQKRSRVNRHELPEQSLHGRVGVGNGSPKSCSAKGLGLGGRGRMPIRAGLSCLPRWNGGAGIVSGPVVEESGVEEHERSAQISLLVPRIVDANSQGQRALKNLFC